MSEDIVYANYGPRDWVRIMKAWEKIMSDETKKQVKEAGEFFKKVQEGAEKYKSVPDKQLGEKIKKVGEGAGEVVKHITERTDH
jgi:hypothetical protein